MRVRRKFEPTDHRVLGLRCIRRLLLIVGFARSLGHQPVCDEGLELDEVGTRLGCALDEPPREIEIAVVVHPGLGDHEHPADTHAMPRTLAPSATSPRTTLPAPMITSAPMRTPSRITVPLPTNVPAPIDTPPLTRAPVAM